jgi:sirohydrochlorin cobaltochelatase
VLSTLPLPAVRTEATVLPADAAGPAPGPPPLLIVGHGTRCVRGEEQFRSFVERVTARLAPRGVDVAGGLIELAPPPVTAAAAHLVARGHRHVIAVPLMLVAAGHAKGDIPAALAREVARYPGLGYRYGAVLGPDPLVLRALTERLDEVLARNERDATHVVLVGRGSTDPDANSEVARAARLFLEAAAGDAGPLAGVEPSFVSLAEPGVPAALERCHRLGATRVVVLPLFMFAGVLPNRIVEQARRWAAGHPAVQVRTAGVIGDCDLLADVVVRRYTAAAAGEVRAHCDNCVYRVAMPGFEHRVGQPQTPHDHPDDPVSGHGHGPGPGRGHGHGHGHGHGRDV